MALTVSKPLEKGTIAPHFSLPDTVSGKDYSLHELKGKKATVVMFICNHCPFVIHVNSQLIALANDYQNRGVAFIAISSNDINTYPQDGPQQMKLQAERLGYPFPYLYDESQEVAQAYDAVCTPDFYVFDAKLKSVYHGQIDNSRPGNDELLTGASMREVLDVILEGKEYQGEEKPSIGCSIKWK